MMGTAWVVKWIDDVIILVSQSGEKYTLPLIESIDYYG